MTHPVEGLKPGPLAGQDLSLLKAGSSVLRSEISNALFSSGDLFTYEPKGDMTGQWVEIDRLSDGKGFSMPHPKCFSYIGEQDAEGWIAWTGGENPVPGMRVDIEHNGVGIAVDYPSGGWDWSRACKFRPASTKPQGGDQGALQAQAPSVTIEGPQAAVVAALQGALEWDKARGYRMPYRVRDPIYAALDAIAKGGA